jgi:hypothetical protein
MEDELEFDEIEYEGYEEIYPEDGGDEDQPEKGGFLRIKSLILLAVFIIPTIFIVIEIITGNVSGAVSPSNVEPVLPPDQFPTVRF